MERAFKFFQIMALIVALLAPWIYFVGLRKSASNAEELLRLYADDQFIHMMPSLDFEGQKEFRRGTQAGEVIDYFAKHFYKTTT